MARTNCNSSYVWFNLVSGIADFNKLIDEREAYYTIKDFPPKPTPLCYWCPFVEKECEYYSLWKPDNKTFEVNKEYIPFSEQNSKKIEEFEW